MVIKKLVNSEKERFWLEVGGQSGWMDDETIKGVYYGMVKHILNELSSRGYVKLPDFGMFKVVEWKGRTYKGMRGGDRVVEGKPSVSFTAGEKLSTYVKNRGKVCE